MNHETIRAIIGVGQFLRADGARLNLRGADLRYADLRGAYLRYADLRGADLRGAYLRGAYLRDADLRYADLRDADLLDANLRYAYLRGADLRDADLRDADLLDANLRGATGMPWHCYGGSAHTGWMPTPTEIQIGCERHTVAHWLAHYAAIGAAHGYTPDQIEEYGAWIKSVAERAAVAREGGHG